MFVESIELNNYRNFDSVKVEFSPGVNIFFGDNAQGKTNILESIFLCSIGKSFRTNKEKEVIHLGETFAKISIDYEKSDRKGTVDYELSDKKSININGVKIKKLSELLGNINIVIFTPDDINILKGRSSWQKKIFGYDDRTIKTSICI